MHHWNAVLWRHNIVISQVKASQGPLNQHSTNAFPEFIPSSLYPSSKSDLSRFPGIVRHKISPEAPKKGKADRRTETESCPDFGQCWAAHLQNQHCLCIFELWKKYVAIKNLKLEQSDLFSINPRVCILFLLLQNCPCICESRAPISTKKLLATVTGSEQPQSSED